MVNAALPWDWSLSSPVASLGSLIQGQKQALLPKLLAVSRLPVKGNILQWIVLGSRSGHLVGLGLPICHGRQYTSGNFPPNIAPCPVFIYLDSEDQEFKIILIPKLEFPPVVLFLVGPYSRGERSMTFIISVGIGLDTEGDVY